MAIIVDCPYCGEKLHVKDEFAGRKGKCPKCEQKFQVPLRGLAASPSGVAAADSRPASPEPRRPAPGPALAVIPPSTVQQESDDAVLAASAAHLFAKLPASREELREHVLAAFRGQSTPPRVSLLRKIGIVIVAAVLAVLPLFYVAALAGIAYGMFWLATSNYGRQLQPAIFWTAECAAGLILLCLTKPLVEPRRRVIEVYPLSSDQEQLLSEFIAAICAQMDAPTPARVQTECSVRFAAEYRRGMLGLAQRDVVLTMGLPLFGSLSVEQLAGLIARQMAQFRRRAACGTMNFIRAINGWLWRSVYEDGRFDAWLARVARRPGFQPAKLLLPLRAARLVAQIVLFIPMFIGNTVASGLMRLTELDADRAAARLVGRQTFASLLVLQGVIEFAWQGVLAELDFLYREQQLPDNLSQQLALRMLDMTPELCAALRDTVAKPEEKPFDARPADEDRLLATRDEPARGVLECHLPARALLTDGEGLARKITWDYYVDQFGPERLKLALKPVPMPAAASQ